MNPEGRLNSDFKVKLTKYSISPDLSSSIPYPQSSQKSEPVGSTCQSSEKDEIISPRNIDVWNSPLRTNCCTIPIFERKEVNSADGTPQGDPSVSEPNNHPDLEGMPTFAGADSEAQNGYSGTSYEDRFGSGIYFKDVFSEPLECHKSDEEQQLYPSVFIDQGYAFAKPDQLKNVTLTFMAPKYIRTVFTTVYSQLY